MDDPRQSEYPKNFALREVRLESLKGGINLFLCRLKQTNGQKGSGIYFPLIRISKHPPADLFLSTITLAEILYGIEKSSVKKKERRLKINQITSVLGICAFDEAAAVEYAVIRTQLEKEGRMISERDTQIASIAIEIVSAKLH